MDRTSSQIARSFSTSLRSLLPRWPVLVWRLVVLRQLLQTHIGLPLSSMALSYVSSPHSQMTFLIVARFIVCPFVCVVAFMLHIDALTMPSLRAHKSPMITACSFLPTCRHCQFCTFLRMALCRVCAVGKKANDSTGSMLSYIANKSEHQNGPRAINYPSGDSQCLCAVVGSEKPLMSAILRQSAPSLLPWLGSCQSDMATRGRL